MRVFLIPVLLLAAAAHSAEIDGSVEDSAKPWTSLSPLESTNDFTFAIVSDRTGSHRAGVFERAMDKLNLLEPAFVVSVGDLIEGYTENLDQLNAEWAEMDAFIAKLNPPFFYVGGNHDLSNEVMANLWQQRFGPSFYHFTYKDVLFLALNSELFGTVEDPDVSLPGPWSLEEQMAFVRKTLHEHQDARWTVVLIHQPLWDPNPGRAIHPQWLAVEELLGSRPYTVFAGHYHQYTQTVRHRRNYVTLATTGGGSQLRGPTWGEFDHVTLVNMRPDGPRIANLVLDGILPADVSTTESREAATALSQSINFAGTVAQHTEFTKDELVVTFNNPTNGPMRIRPSVTREANFQIRGLENITVDAGAEKAMTLTLSASAPTPYRELTVAAVDWEITTAPEGATGMAVTTTTPVRPLNVERISHRLTPKIDGDLNEWPALDYHVHQQGDVALPDIDRADASFQFALATDDEAAYVAVRVVDDRLVADPNRIARQQDGIALTFDTRPEDARSRNMPVVPAIIDGFYGQAIVQIFNPQGAEEDTFIPALERWAEHVQHKIEVTDDGYTLEARIAHEVLDEMAGESWHTARIGIRLYDLDDDHGSVDVLHWQPYRYGNAPLTGSHLFSR